MALVLIVRGRALGAVRVAVVVRLRGAPIGRVERFFETFRVHFQMGLVWTGPDARAEGEVRRLQTMVRRLRRLVGGRSIPAAP